MGRGRGHARVTARAAGTPLGTGSFSAASPVQGGCSGWPCTRSGGSRCPPSVSHTAGNRCRVTEPGCPWLPGAGGQRNASSGLWQLPGPGILCPALGTCPVSLLCPCKPTVALPGQRCPFHPPASSRRECPQGGGQGGDRAVQGHGWVFPSPASAPQSSPGQGGCGAVPALLPHAAACRRG